MAGQEKGVWSSFLCELPPTCSTLGCTTGMGMIKYSCLESRDGFVGPGLV